MKERKKLFQNHEFCTKGKVHIMSLLHKGNVDIMDIWKKKEILLKLKELVERSFLYETSMICQVSR